MSSKDQASIQRRFRSLSDSTAQRTYTCKCRSKRRSLQRGDTSGERSDAGGLSAAWNSV